ncbi:MAG: hypothetical protein C4344_02370 [Acidimicrobiia bacterium]
MTRSTRASAAAAIPAAQGTPEVAGAYHRSIELTSPSPSEVAAELEDDFHHFRVWLGHDGERVVTVGAEAVRYPWTTCPGARAELLALVGVPLATDCTAIARHLPARRNCTHMYDLAGLALAHAGLRRPDRRYDIEVPDRDPDGRTRAVLLRDGVELLTWDLCWHEIEGPLPWRGAPLRRGFIAWVRANLDPEVAEAAIVLRRAVAISFGRMMDLDVYERASELGETMLGTCYTFSPELIGAALRVKGSTRR